MFLRHRHGAYELGSKLRVWLGGVACSSGAPHDEVLLHISHPGACQAGTVGQVHPLHDREALQQVAQSRVCDVTLRPQRLHHPCTDDIVELRTKQPLG